MDNNTKAPQAHPARIMPVKSNTAQNSNPFAALVLTNSEAEPQAEETSITEDAYLPNLLTSIEDIHKISALKKANSNKTAIGAV